MGVVLKSRGGQPPLAATRSMQHLAVAASVPRRPREIMQFYIIYAV
jgi:hypothetical protein